MDNEEISARLALIRPLFEIVKGLAEVSGKQQFLIEGLRHTFGELLTVLAGTGEPSATPERSPAQDAAIARAQAEIQELERLFSREPEKTERENKLDDNAEK